MYVSQNPLLLGERKKQTFQNIIQKGEDKQWKRNTYLNIQVPKGLYF